MVAIYKPARKHNSRHTDLRQLDVANVLPTMDGKGALLLRLDLAANSHCLPT